MKVDRRRGLLDVATGLLVGAVIVVGIGISEAIATGLNSGLVLGVDGNAHAVATPSIALVPGLFVFVISLLLFVAGPRWWDPPSARTSAGAILLAVLIVGNVRFSDAYLREFGAHPWWETVDIAYSQSMFAYAILGVVFASRVLEIARRPRASSS